MKTINWTVVKIEAAQRQEWRENAQWWRENAQSWTARGYPEDAARCMRHAMRRLNWIAKNNRELREQFSRGMY